MESVLYGIAQIKKAAGIATAAAWLLLGLAYLSALIFGTFGTFSQQLFHNLFEKSTGLLGSGFGLFVFLGMIFFYPIGDESERPFFDKLMGAFMKTMRWLLGIGLALLLVAFLLQIAFEMMLVFARWLHHEGIPASKVVAEYITVAWFVLMGSCLAILIATRNKSEALKVFVELLMESLQEIAEFFAELLWSRFRRE